MKKITIKQTLLALAIVCSVVIGGKLLADSKQVATIDPPGIKLVADGATTNTIDPPGI